LMFF